MEKPFPASNRVLVTGAGGMIGLPVVQALLENGIRVRAMSKTGRINMEAHPLLEVVQCDMTDAESVRRCVRNIVAVIHLAARKGDESDSEAVNVIGAKNLIHACKEINISRIVNVSTQSTKLARKGIYGKTKSQADELFAASGLPVVTLKPSVIYDDEGRGILGTVMGMTSLPLVPMIGDGKIHLRPMHANDLATVLVQALTRDVVGKTYDIGGRESLTLRALTMLVLKKRGMRKPIVSLPLSIAMVMAKCTTWMTHPPLTVSNVLGAKEDLPMDIEPMLRDFDVQPRTMEVGIDAAIAARAQVQNEDRSILTYVLSFHPTWKPTQKQIDLYRKAIEKNAVNPKHRIDASVIKHPILLGAMDAVMRVRKDNGILRLKLLTATAIAECSPSSATILLPKKRSRMSIIGITVLGVLHTGCLLTLGIFIKIFAPSFYQRNAGL